MTKLDDKFIIQGKIYLIAYLAIYQKLKILWHFETSVNTGPHGAENVKKHHSSHSFYLIYAKHYGDIGYNAGLQTVTFLDNRPNLKEIVAL